MNVAVVYVKSSPAVGFALKQVISIIDENTVFDSTKDGTTPLESGMLLDNAVFDVPKELFMGVTMPTLQVDDVTTPTAVVAA